MWAGLDPRQAGGFNRPATPEQAFYAGLPSHAPMGHPPLAPLSAHTPLAPLPGLPGPHTGASPQLQAPPGFNGQSASSG